MSCILKCSTKSANPDLSIPPVSGNDWPARRTEGYPTLNRRENLLPKGAATPDGVGCRIGRGYSVFARKGNPRGLLASFARQCHIWSDSRRVQQGKCDDNVSDPPDERRGGGVAHNLARTAVR